MWCRGHSSLGLLLRPTARPYGSGPVLHVHSDSDTPLAGQGWPPSLILLLDGTTCPAAPRLELRAPLKTTFNSGLVARSPLKRFWPIPLFAAAYLVHIRYRAWRPRVLRRLTTLKLPELYGAMALGHAANIEADRLCEKIVPQHDLNRYRIHRYSVAMANSCHDTIQKKYAECPDPIWPNVAYPHSDKSVTVQSSADDDNWGNRLTGLLDTARWQLRSQWSDELSRAYVAHTLAPHIQKLGLSDHDARILLWYVAERIYTKSYSKPSLF
ncbi:hypothetical protein L226DRAFT_617301 [Lentinus tigrinus ALCF2SS1-7]|uniref:Uncharacterized protein n=1 Tax=Lentinus tigrinus ALCF2SS1-6 TaxID=1328759 RepID=A0A5C2S8B7_9APHY|nr:hypothetical protein L227DRAFT_611940 [Lentinus tigrinus ALCF2SS1-6]RPD68737.1 hypothetical protein L226DRAFT_617301 [Lentinus tigrinus ALCF2SS1-7]